MAYYWKCCLLILRDSIDREYYYLRKKKLILNHSYKNMTENQKTWLSLDATSVFRGSNALSEAISSVNTKDDVIKQLCSFSELLHTPCKNTQRSRCEQLIIILAKAYDGYQFNLHAFVAFRGWISCTYPSVVIYIIPILYFSIDFFSTEMYGSNCSSNLP